ncbi:MAG: agmatinase [Bdellovibrionales bacterium]|nr:agmatinase [Bdellovibrionales bacterium]
MKMTPFGGLPIEFTERATAKVAVVPTPFDGTSTWGKGADRGPRALLDASANMELYDIETESEPYKVGIFTSEPVCGADSERNVNALERQVGELLDEGKFVVTLGGEHSISTGPIRAHAKKYPEMSVLQLDAHTDLRDEYEGTPYNHACIMARTLEVTDSVVSVGIRSMDTSELENAKKTTIFFAEQIHGRDDWHEKAIKGLRDNVYITVDLDVFDPSCLPSTGTPEPGGMDWYSVTRFLAKVFRERNVVGFDVVELAPTSERSSDFLAAKLVYKMLAYKFS